MLISLVVASLVAAAPQPPAAAFVLPVSAEAALRRQLAEMNDAALRNDDAAVVKAMYPRVVQAMGGPAEAERKVEAARLSLAADRAKLLSATAGRVRGCQRPGKQIQCVVEGTQVIQVPGGRLVAETETLAFSSDGGARWTFLAGGQDATALRSALPELSADLPLHPRSPPRLERN